MPNRSLGAGWALASGTKPKLSFNVITNKVKTLVSTKRVICLNVPEIMSLIPVMLEVRGDHSMGDQPGIIIIFRTLQTGNDSACHGKPGEAISSVAYIS
jgi:hypothetical protein